MSRDIIVYSHKVETIPLDDILAHMQARGVPVRWQPDPFVQFFTKKTPGTWRAGLIVPEGDVAPEDNITIAVDALTQRVKRRLVTAYAQALSDPQREALLGARTSYKLSVTWLPHPRRERVLAHLVDVLADLGNGLILDTEHNQFYDRTQYRSQWAAFLDTTSQS